MASFKIRFVNSNGFFARAIDWATDSLFDHAEIESETGSWIGAHDDGGVQDRPADYLKPTREYRYAIPCTDEQYEKAMTWAKSKIGTKYNFSDIGGLLFHDRKLNNPHAVICSQFTLMAAQAGGIQMLNVLGGYEFLVTPETLHLSPLLIGNCTYRNG
jgi:uncharacterized protein YycO